MFFFLIHGDLPLVESVKNVTLSKSKIKGRANHFKIAIHLISNIKFDFLRILGALEVLEFHHFFCPVGFFEFHHLF